MAVQHLFFDRSEYAIFPLTVYMTCCRVWFSCASIRPIGVDPIAPGRARCAKTLPDRALATARHSDQRTKHVGGHGASAPRLSASVREC